jgi:hypothetical protein
MLKSKPDGHKPCFVLHAKDVDENVRTHTIGEVLSTKNAFDVGHKTLFCA